MKKKLSDEGEKKSKIDQTTVLLGIISAISAIAIAMIPFLMNRSKSEPVPTSAPVVINPTTAVVLPTENATEAPTFAPSVEPPTATTTQQVGIFNEKLANDPKGPSTTQFKPDPTIYVIFDSNDPTGKNKLTIRWSVVKVTGNKADREISSTPHTIVNNHFEEAFKPGLKLPGSYKVELTLNDNTVPDKTIVFEILH